VLEAARMFAYAKLMHDRGTNAFPHDPEMLEDLTRTASRDEGDRGFTPRFILGHIQMQGMRDFDGAAASIQYLLHTMGRDGFPSYPYPPDAFTKNDVMYQLEALLAGCFLFSGSIRLAIESHHRQLQCEDISEEQRGQAHARLASLFCLRYFQTPQFKDGEIVLHHALEAVRLLHPDAEGRSTIYYIQSLMYARHLGPNYFVLGREAFSNAERAEARELHLYGKSASEESDIRKNARFARFLIILLNIYRTGAIMAPIGRESTKFTCSRSSSSTRCWSRTARMH
jgi:hypothetical protein